MALTPEQATAWQSSAYNAFARKFDREWDLKVARMQHFGALASDFYLAPDERERTAWIKTKMFEIERKISEAQTSDN